ncbi:helix-turn-helix transcriptional regulator [Streptomyces sp. NPDC058049]|uniref:helix-turn-helix transcriptional regulator n=1 Tax=Streptomyces sp. NPDC058049 TaxID=3346314 RepID=UPI0036E2F9A8
MSGRSPCTVPFIPASPAPSGAVSASTSIVDTSPDIRQEIHEKKDVYTKQAHAGGTGDESLSGGSWTFLTSHARVLLALARDPGVRLREAAETCVLTERTVQAIVADLEQGGYLTRVRNGRRNRYRINPGATFRHPAEAGRDIEGLLTLFADDPPVPRTPHQS